MIVGRILGFLFLAAAVGVLGLDIVEYVESEEGFQAMSTGEVWHMLHPASLQLAEPAIARHVAPWLWYDVILPVLTTPAVLVFGLIGIILVAIFRKRAEQKRVRRDDKA